MNDLIFTYAERSLGNEEAEFLVQEIKSSPNITGYTKKEWLEFFKTIVVARDNKLIGVCAITKISEDWFEIAVIYIVERYRSQGIGTELFKIANELLQGKKVYCTSRNSIIIKEMSRYGYIIYNNMFKLPFSIHLFNARWLCSFYRIREGFRKRYVHKLMVGFVFGIRTPHGKLIEKYGQQKKS